MADINWKVLPYNHSGKWEKKFDSIMSPGEKVNWPQYLVELIIVNRAKIFDEYKVTKGKGWSKPLSKQVRSLQQQIYVILNYFPHPDEEDIVYKTFLTYFKKYKPLKIGQFRKYRTATDKVSKKEYCNITQCEKDTIKGLLYLYNQFKKETEKQHIQETTVQSKDDPTYRTQSISTVKKSIFDLIKEEEETQKNGQQ